ncbi:hypothetical protein CRUP_005801 [Coryphaenoides rupestris]|nr:hypothetical protein CRUP_005801 [Coryphaenoides rupestris]
MDELKVSEVMVILDAAFWFSVFESPPPPTPHPWTLGECRVYHLAVTLGSSPENSNTSAPTREGRRFFQSRPQSERSS